MNRDVQALVTELGGRIEALIEAAVAVRVQGVQAALRGMGLTDGQPRRAPQSKAGPIKAKPAATKRRNYDEAFKKRFVAEVVKVPPGERLAAARREGVGESSMYAWIKRLGGVKLKRGGANARKHTDAQKREVVARGRAMAPGDRETYLADLGLSRDVYYKWASWAKANPA